MIKAIKLNLNLLIQRKELYFSILAMLLIITIHMALNVSYILTKGQIFENLDPVYSQLLMTSRYVDFRYVAVLIFPLLSILCFSDSYAEEKNIGLDRLIETKVSQFHYLIAKAIVVFFFSLFLIMALFLFNYFISCLIYRLGLFSDRYGSIVSNVKRFTSFMDDIRISATSVFFFIQFAEFSFISACLALLAFAMSLFTQNRVIINFTPMAVLVLNFLLFSIFNINRSTFINVMLMDGIGNALEIILPLIILFLCVLIVLVIGIKKREQVA